MTSPQQFNCVLCKETFTSKEDLQTHFRKHGDPKFNEYSKLKNKTQNASSDEKRNEDAEMVSCDVCTEVFPTISKAITHKHKKHPEHDAKYFCPWCGKLFTMKHLYNKHLQSNHKDLERKDDINFHCDVCNVDFYVASAMIYHNKFFHRQDTDLPTIGHSKKLKMVNQDVLQIYYCSFCGDEYDNKVNLHKHTIDDHEDENQSPEDVLRCPLCEALFYHLDAYELHLTFHSIDDLYTEKNELFEEITEYSLETVPPLMEKVENAEPQDAETAINAIGLEQFLEMATNDSKDGERPKKSKKHKKHKKSKKSAITLDEFLNMNKDVFGEGIDFQGVEEVPTKVVKKNLKQKKGDKPNLKILKRKDLDKLKKQGIVVKMKSSKQPVNAVRVVTKIPSKNLQISQQPTNTANSQAKTPDDVLSKFLSQGNSQIKIVKKSAETPDNYSINKSILHSDIEDVKRSPTPENVEIECDVQQSGYTSSEAEGKDESLSQPIKNRSPTVSKDIQDNLYSNVTCSDENSKSIKTKLAYNEALCLKESADDAEMEAEISTAKSPHTYLNSSSSGKPIPSVGNQETKNNVIALEGINTNVSSKSSLDALKHLSHLITVKSVNKAVDSKNKPKPQDCGEIYTVLTDSDQNKNNDGEETLNLNENNCDLPSNETNETSKTVETLKALNKNITVKPLSHSPKTNNIVKANLNKNVSTSVVEQNVPKKISMANNLIQSPKQSPKLKQCDENISDKLPKQNDNVNLLKHLTNITAKPISKPNHEVVSISSSNNTQKVDRKQNVYQYEEKKESHEEIEIFNIDDSDSDEAEKGKTMQEVGNIICNKNPPNKVLEKLKNVKNITMKSVSQQKTIVNKSIVKKMPSLKESLQNNDQCSMSDFSDEDDQDMQMPANLSINQKLTLQSSNIQALKNLGKHITVKSRNSSPSVPNLNLSHDSRDGLDDADSDNDSLPSGKVKISEINEDNLSDDGIGDDKLNKHEYDANVSVQSPDAANSDHCDDFNEDEELDDIESQIQTSTLKRPFEMEKSRTLDLNNLNKNLTIKSISKDNTDQPSSSKGPAVPITNQELSIKPYKPVKPGVSKAPSIGNTSNITKAVKATNQSVNRNMTTNNQLNTVNKEVTVKTFQTETVIQEITTTVTKTIKTVNQTMKQAKNVSHTVQPVKYQRVQGMKTNQVQNFQGVTVRQASPVTGTKVKGLAPTRPASTANVRPGNQLVPVRPSFNQVRSATPRMPLARQVPTSTPKNVGPQVGKPIKMAANNVITAPKRTSEDNLGHFSCFKKPKESLIPVSDIPNFDSEQMSSAVHYTCSQKKFSSATKTVRGNAVFTSTQMSSETSSSSQQLSKLNNLSGLKIVKTSQNKQTMQAEEKSDLSASQRNTLNAIEKLQKQGLLVKKPRIEVNEDSNLSGEENDEYLTEEPDD